MGMDNEIKQMNTLINIIYIFNAVVLLRYVFVILL
jgi:hypothetical protein